MNVVIGFVKILFGLLILTALVLTLKIKDFLFSGPLNLIASLIMTQGGKIWDFILLGIIPENPGSMYF